MFLKKLKKRWENKKNVKKTLKNVARIKKRKNVFLHLWEQQNRERQNYPTTQTLNLTLTLTPSPSLSLYLGSP